MKALDAHLATYLCPNFNPDIGDMQSFGLD
jgi:hypothetical protein